ncbi:class I SAM-dependent methyltransferase [Nocardia sp. GCM10030253]|uniref:class I SAM-dependent methyltransferase n=1 Tax=Nocardia sp. GCM10030253 TaxID=3273404 RepID=UPI003645502A
MKGKMEFRDVYMDGCVLETKIDVHTRYSSIPIDLPAAVMARCGVPNEVDVLDIGCGTGHLIEHFARIGHAGRLFGLDLVRPSIADTPRKRYTAGDAEYLPFPDDSFDVITCIHTLSHISDLQAAMSEARRVLRDPGSYLATANSLHAYPHTAEYRQLIHSEFGWGEPVFTTSRVNAETLEQTLAPLWGLLSVDFLDGELRIPVEEYPTYFAANIPTWDRTPTAAEQIEILRQVAEWARRDQRDGCIVEPKRVAVAVASTTAT